MSLEVIATVLTGIGVLAGSGAWSKVCAAT